MGSGNGSGGSGSGSGSGSGGVCDSGSDRGSDSGSDSGVGRWGGSGSGDGTAISNGSSSGYTLAHEGGSKQHARSSVAAAEAVACVAMDLDGLSTTAGAAAPPLAPTHGPAAVFLHEGAQYDKETEDAAPEAAAAARVRPLRPSSWVAMTKVKKRHWYKQGGKRR